jgi:hypothetical protein
MDAPTACAYFPVALHPIRSPPDLDDSGQVLALPPNRAGRELPQPISAESKSGPFRPAAPKLPELRNRLLMASAPLRGQITE